MREFLADICRSQFTAIRDRPRRAVSEGKLSAERTDIDAGARYYVTIVQGLSIQAREGATRAELEDAITGGPGRPGTR